jgi:hypothetical protein
LREQPRVEIHQQPDLGARQSKIREDLSVEKGNESFDALDLHDHQIGNQEVDSVPSNQTIAVENWHVDLSAVVQVHEIQLNAQGSFVDAFEQSRTEPPVDFYATSDDRPGER